VIAVPAQRPAVDLEQAAAAWDLACAHAHRAAAALTAAYGAHPDVVSVTADGDRAVVVLRITDLRAWYVHRAAMGVQADDVVLFHDACSGIGRQGWIPVQIVGLGVPMLLNAVAAAARLPYRLWDQVYDLAVTHEDVRGDRWRYCGEQSPDGIPLMSVVGRQEKCRFTNVVRYVGPLVPVASTPERIASVSVMPPFPGAGSGGQPVPAPPATEPAAPVTPASVPSSPVAPVPEPSVPEPPVPATPVPTVPAASAAEKKTAARGTSAAGPAVTEAEAASATGAEVGAASATGAEVP
jgi:hypothetical protein